MKKGQAEKGINFDNKSKYRPSTVILYFFLYLYESPYPKVQFSYYRFIQ